MFNPLKLSQGVGSGRTERQEQGGFGVGGGDYDNDNESGRGNKKGDSTAGKLLEKAGGLFKNEKMKESGAEKRREAGNDY
jgi:hypothetical protein